MLYVSDVTVTIQNVHDVSTRIKLECTYVTKLTGSHNIRVAQPIKQYRFRRRRPAGARRTLITASRATCTHTYLHNEHTAVLEIYN